MLRFLWLNFFILICTLVSCAAAFFVIPFNKDGKKIHFYFAVPWAKTILWICGIKIRAEGLENISAQMPYIYMTNHQSYFDIFALLATLSVNFKFIMKQELMKIPILGFTMRNAGYIGIERKDPRKAIKSMNAVAEKIKHGTSILIFPEGTRSKDGRLLPLKKGGFHLALKSGCKIVPIGISNSHRIVPKGSLKINRGSIHLRVGRPISTSPYSKKSISELMDKVQHAIEGLMQHEPRSSENHEESHPTTGYSSSEKA